MIGVILAGGLGTRLHPLTIVTNKHLLPIFDKPMIWFPLHYMAEVGIKDVVIVTGDLSGGEIMKYVRNGQEWGLDHVSYVHQDGNGGIADAVRLTEPMVDQQFMVMLGDNLFAPSFAPMMKEVITKYSSGLSEARVVLNRIQDRDRLKKFGVADFDKQKRIVDVVEKPTNPPSEWAVTGCYIYPLDVFEVIKKLKPSKRGELEVSDINRYYAKRGTLYYHKFEGSWTDAGTVESLHQAGMLRQRGVI